MHNLNIEIGGVVCRLTSPEKRFHGDLGRIYREFRSDAPADITVDLRLVERFEQDELRAALDAGTVIKAGTDIAGLYRLRETPYDGLAVRLSMLKQDFRRGLKYMNLVIPPVYYTAARDGKGPRSMLVHSSGIRRPSGVLLFCGPSDTGKTTVAGFYRSDKGAVINDEMLLVSLPDRIGSPAMAGGVPIIGGLPQRSNTTAPLAAVVMLKQSGRTAFREINPGDAYLRFMKQVIARRTFYPELNETRMLLLANADFSEAIAASTPCYEMEFTLDRKRFRHTIEELEAAATGRV